MKTLTHAIFIVLSLSLLNSCHKDEDNKPEVDILNYAMSCYEDSTFYYCTFDFDKIYLDLHTRCVTIKFSDSVSQEYMDALVAKNCELDSISYVAPTGYGNLAFAYLRPNIICEDIKSVLKSLTQEDRVSCANPNFITKESIANGVSPDDMDAIMGLTDEFVVAFQGSNLDSIYAIAERTKTTYIQHNSIYVLLSANKNSLGNSMEMSWYFYETGNFKFSSPNFLATVQVTKWAFGFFHYGSM